MNPDGSSTAFEGKKVILCVTGGIAAYKVAQLARDLTQYGADVQVVLTASAERFIGAQTFAALTGNPVHSYLFSDKAEVPHVELARGADLLVVAPATANSLAKIAGGFASDLMSATVLSAACPILVVPAMHTEMWTNPATIDNVAMLVARGVKFAGPASGPLSSGDSGEGRMIEPPEILAEAAAILERADDFAGLSVLITAGGTREPIDPVRFIGNHSSGRMGYMLAEAAARRGAKVMLVSGATNLVPPPGVDVISAHTADEMRDAVIEHASAADVVIKAAAVADFKPANSAPRKLKKVEGAPEVSLIRTPDILKELGTTPGLRKPGGILVGFAAETEPDLGKLAELAEGKRTAKGADFVVANQVGVSDSGFEVPTNRAVIATPSGPIQVGLVTKRELATILLDLIVASRH